MIRQHDNELMCKSLKALAQPLLAPSGFAGAPAPRDGLGIGGGLQNFAISQLAKPGLAFPGPDPYPSRT
ncbi:hypothetical protein PCASD_06962 [Puccinia coronata f. sp. avenae]|uniref:Uncharacterized protein n=1 Tax=Puccinia coronata f. sp. avenae TaxID=200324 RepID=A0A2N5V4W8_9BASI|nr:hypothetical protein PCASD_06962 [Puccinia coronata f. sp. avenae]